MNEPRPVVPNSNAKPAPARPVVTARPAVSVPPKQVQPVPQPAEVDDSPIALVDEEVAEKQAPVSKIVFGPDVGHRKENWKRKVQATGAGAIRVRTFHGKMSEQGLEYLDNQINEWLDSHPEIEVKHVTSGIGMFEGKVKDLAMVVSVWY